MNIPINPKWFCCGRWIRTNFCPHCGGKKKLQESCEKLTLNEALGHANELCSGWERQQVASQNYSARVHEQIAQIAKILESEGVGDDERHSLENQIDGLSYTASKTAGTALKYGSWVKTVRRLIDEVETS